MDLNPNPLIDCPPSGFGVSPDCACWVEFGAHRLWYQESLEGDLKKVRALNDRQGDQWRPTANGS